MVRCAAAAAGIRANARDTARGEGRGARGGARSDRDAAVDARTLVRVTRVTEIEAEILTRLSAEDLGTRFGRDVALR